MILLKQRKVCVHAHTLRKISKFIKNNEIQQLNKLKERLNKNKLTIKI